MLIKQAHVNKVWALALHRTVEVVASFFKAHLALDKRAVERERKVFQLHKVEVLSNIHLHPIVVGPKGIDKRINKVGAARHGIGPFDGVVKLLVEQGHRHLFALRGIVFVAKIAVVNIGGFEHRISHHITAQIKVVEHRRREFSKFGTVGGTPVGSPELMCFRKAQHRINRRKEVVIVVVGILDAFFVLTSIHLQYLTAKFVAYPGINHHFPKRDIQPCIPACLRTNTAVVVEKIHLFVHI